MKKMIGVVAAVALIATASLAMANGKGLGIKGSPHDFSDNMAGGVATTVETGTDGWNFRGEICRTCHVPHDHGKANYLVNGQPTLLWNRAVSGATYQLYNSDTMDSTTQQPTGNSKLCLGCHDGTVALDTFDKYAVSGNTGSGGGISKGANIATLYGAGNQVPSQSAGTDLRGTHPLSIPYLSSHADVTKTSPSLNDPAVAAWNDGTKVNKTLQGTTAQLLQCSTCHDVHDSVGSAVPATHLLRTTNAQSQLCLTCHKK